MSLRRPWLVAVLGAIGFLVVHGFLELTWNRLFQPAQLERAWFLGSPVSIVVTQVTLGVLALLVALSRCARWRDRLVDMGMLAFGAMTALAGLFFLIGPERLMVGPTSLWPVVLASAFWLLFPAIVGGTLLGGYLVGLGVGFRGSQK